MTDEDTVTLQGVENMKRKNLSPMDEAQKCRQLRDIYKAKGMKSKEAVLAVAEAFNTSKTVVYERLALFDLDSKMQAEVRAGVVSPTHATLLLKIEDPALRAKALEEMKDGAGENEQIVSTREAESIANQYVKEEAAAKAWQAATEEAQDNGWQVLTKGIHFYNKDYFFNEDYVLMNGRCRGIIQEEGILPMTWEEALGQHAPNRILAKNLATNEAAYLYLKSEAIEALKKTAHKLDLPEEGSGEDALAAQREHERALERAAEDRRAKLFESFQVDAFVEAKNCDGPGAWKVVWELLFETDALAYMDGDDCAQVLESHGFTHTDEEVENGDFIEKLKAYGRELDGKRLRGLIVQCLLKQAQYWKSTAQENGPAVMGWHPLLGKIVELLPGVQEIPAWNEEDEKPKEKAKPKAKKPAQQKVAKDTKGKTAKAKGASQKEAKGAKDKAAQVAEGGLGELLLAELKAVGAQGFSAKEAAEKLGKKVGDIHVWMATAGKKLGVKRLKAGVYALEAVKGGAK